MSEPTHIGVVVRQEVARILRLATTREEHVKNWTEINALDRHLLPQSGGVYAIYVDGRLRYVGQSINVRHRFKLHGIRLPMYSALIETPWGEFRDVRVKFRRSSFYGDWATRELRLIRRLQPEWNVIGTPRRRRPFVGGVA